VSGKSAPNDQRKIARSDNGNGSRLLQCPPEIFAGRESCRKTLRLATFDGVRIIGLPGFG
jgi:hypothetical protein